MDLRAHTLLADIPLHDVWIAHLSGGGNDRTLLDTDEAMAEGVTGDETVALAATIVAYVLMARVLGLASEECVDTLSLVRQRLTEADRARSIYRPGERGFVYHFESEALLEIQTCAAHALYVFALLVVYPSILRRIEQRWRVKWRAGQGTPDASAPGGFGSAAESPGQLSW
jgi:hypothetical protein